MYLDKNTLINHIQTIQLKYGKIKPKQEPTGSNISKMFHPKFVRSETCTQRQLRSHSRYKKRAVSITM